MSSGRQPTDTRDVPDELYAGPIELSRVRAAEWITAAGGALLIISSFLSWYGLKGNVGSSYSQLQIGSGTTDAWTAMSITSWLILIVGLLALALVIFQAGCRAPAVPVSVATAILPFGILLFLILLNRVLINVPGGSDLESLRYGAVIGLVSSLVVVIGAFLSVRVDGIRAEDGPQEIETFRRNPQTA